MPCYIVLVVVHITVWPHRAVYVHSLLYTVHTHRSIRSNTPHLTSTYSVAKEECEYPVVSGYTSNIQPRAYGVNFLFDNATYHRWVQNVWAEASHAPSHAPSLPAYEWLTACMLHACCRSSVSVSASARAAAAATAIFCWSTSSLSTG